MATIATVWDGPRTFIRLRMTRGSAAGGSLAGYPLHILAGYTSAMEPVSRCNLLFVDEYVAKRRPGDERICSYCKETF